jgi:hypothetical protein
MTSELSLFVRVNRIVLGCLAVLGLVGCGGGKILIKGRVVDDTGAPIARATVQTVPDTDVVYTQRSGHFLLRQKINAMGELEEIPKGVYQVSVSKSGFQPLTAQVTAEGGELDLKNLPLKQRTAFIGDGKPSVSDDPESKSGDGKGPKAGQ